MLAVAGLALAGRHVLVGARLRNAAHAILGFGIGAGLSPESLARLAAWPWSLVLLALSLVTSIALVSRHLERVHAWPKATARFAAIPGALTFIVALAERSAVDLPRVAITQTVRLVVLVAVLPWLVVWFTGFPPAPTQPQGETTALTLISIPYLIAAFAASLAGGFVFRAFRSPAPFLLGTMIPSALLHGGGLDTPPLPHAFLPAAFIVVGASIGARFTGTGLREIGRSLLPALTTVGLALLVAALAAAIGSHLLGLPFGQLLLAYAPGGLEAMTSMALAIDLDAGFVGVHHLLRFMALSLLVPLWLRRSLEREAS